MPTAAAQINVRLERELKEAGDRQLELAGRTPSQAVRALWSKVSKGGDEARAVLDAVFTQGDTPEPSEQAARKLAALERFEETQSGFLARLKQLGVNPNELAPMTKDEAIEAREQYFLEKLGE